MTHLERTGEVLLPGDWLMAMSVGHFLDYWVIREGRAHCGRRHPRQAVLVYIRKQVENLPEEQHSSILSASVPAHRFLPWVPV